MTPTNPTKMQSWRIPADLLSVLKKTVKDSQGKFRSVNHAVEIAIRQLIEKEKQP